MWTWEHSNLRFYPVNLRGKRVFEALPCWLKMKNYAVEMSISIPLNRTVPPPTYSPGWSPSQYHCACWGGCPLCLQGLQWRPTSHPVAETHHSERQSLRPRWTPLCPSVKGKFLHTLFPRLEANPSFCLVFFYPVDEGVSDEFEKSYKELIFSFLPLWTNRSFPCWWFLFSLLACGSKSSCSAHDVCFCLILRVQI